MPRKIPTFQIPRTGDADTLALHVERALNDIALRLNASSFPVDVDVSNHRVKNVINPTESRDAVNLETLRDHIAKLKKELTVGLHRPRKPGALPGPFRTFTAEHFLNRPDLPCAEAEPKIKVTIGLPTQVNLTSGLVSDEVKKRNTDYVEVQSQWDALTTSLGSAATGSTSTMTVGTGSQFKANATYKIGSEIVRVVTGWTGTGNAVPIERGQEGSTPGTATASEVVYWYSRIVREEFSPNDNGVLTAEPIIDNNERVHFRVFTGYSVNNEGFPGSTSTCTLTLAQPPAITDLVANPRFGEAILTWSEHDNADSTYKYRVYRRTDGGALTSVPPFNGTYLYDEVDATHIGSYVYTDKILLPSEANYATTTYTYGVEAINILCTAGTGDTAGPLQGDLTPEPATSDVTGISASESPVCGPDSTINSEITVSFTPPSDSNWGGVEIYMLRPGDTNPVLVAGGDDSPMLFITPTTGETVTLYFVSYTLGGQRNLPILSQPNTTVSLDGQTSAPAPVSDLFCQIVEDTHVLSWDNNLECDLSNYEVADTGDVAPPTQSDVEDKHVIAVVPATPPGTATAASLRPRFEFREPTYTGVSNGTVITMPESGPYWPDNMVLVDGTSRNVHIIAPTATDAPALTNDGTSVTFSAGAIPTGTVDFWFRGAQGEHSFYVRAVNNTGLKSDWRPAPPNQLACLPTIPDGSYDDRTPILFNGQIPGGAAVPISFFSGFVLTNGPKKGSFTVLSRAVTPLALLTSDVITLKKGIGGISAHTVYVDYIPSYDTAGTTTTTATFHFAPDLSEGNYSTETFVLDTTSGWAILNNAFSVELPGVSVRGVRLVCKNWWGTSTSGYLHELAGTSTVSTHIRHTGYRPEPYTMSAALDTSANLDLDQTTFYIHTLTTSTTTIAAPTNSRLNQEFKICVRQDGTGGRQIAWNSEFFGPSNYEIDGSPNCYNVFSFKTIGTGTHLIVAEPVLGLT